MEKKFKISIPEGINFNDLELARKPGGGISFKAGVINTICDASGIDKKILCESDEGNMAELIIAWYDNHLSNGVERDQVADDLIAEVMAEDRLGEGISHKPGQA